MSGGLGLTRGGLGLMRVEVTLRWRGRGLACTLDTDQLLDDPMKISYSFFIECDLIDGSYCGGPPR